MILQKFSNCQNRVESSKLKDLKGREAKAFRYKWLYMSFPNSPLNCKVKFLLIKIYQSIGTEQKPYKIMQA
jgi:hypothetical protein